MVPLGPKAAPWDQGFRITADDGMSLRAGLWRAPRSRRHRGLAILLPGRTEVLEKVAIPATALRTRGFDVASLDWRGQGHSDRLLSRPLVGHVGDFSEYERDLSALLASDPVRAAGPPVVAVAHSMGGAILLGAVAAGRLAPLPTVFSAPMIDIAMDDAMRIASRAIGALACLTDQEDRWPPFGPMGTPYAFTASAQDNLLTHDAEVFDWWCAALRADPRLQLAMPSLGWIAAAERRVAAIQSYPPFGAPALAFVGTEERVVSRDAVRDFAKASAAVFLEVAGGRHEILIEAEPMRGQAWAAIDDFLARAGL